MEIQNRQRTVDFVNQSMTSPSPRHSLKVEDLANMAEELGQMNYRYQTIASKVSEQLKHFDAVHSKWKDYEELIDALKVWFAEQDTRLGSIIQLHRPTALQQAVRDCQVRCSFCSSVPVKKFYSQTCTAESNAASSRQSVDILSCHTPRISRCSCYCKQTIGLIFSDRHRTKYILWQNLSSSSFP